MDRLYMQYLIPQLYHGFTGGIERVGSCHGIRLMTRGAEGQTQRERGREDVKRREEGRRKGGGRVVGVKNTL